MAGFAQATVGSLPVNGLRHPLTQDTNGWYIWFGDELSTNPDFFVPVHAEHIYDEYPQLIRLLGLPPGYRFLIAGDYLDVWYEKKIVTGGDEEKQ